MPASKPTLAADVVSPLFEMPLSVLRPASTAAIAFLDFSAGKPSSKRKPCKSVAVKSPSLACSHFLSCSVTLLSSALAKWSFFIPKASAAFSIATSAGNIKFFLNPCAVGSTKGPKV